MGEMGIFDVLGPNMIGPSSSHTAGAVRIAKLASDIVQGEIRKVEFRLYGSFAQTYKGHGSDRALVAGILGFSTEDVRIRDSFSIARERGVAFKFTPDKERQCPHPNTVDIIIEVEGGYKSYVTGVSVGGGAVIITNIDDVELNFTGEYHTILVKQKDTPGVLAHIANALSGHGINIAFMRLYRESKGEIAYSVIEADESISQEVVDEISLHGNIMSATLIQAF